MFHMSPVPLSVWGLWGCTGPSRKLEGSWGLTSCSGFAGHSVKGKDFTSLRRWLSWLSNSQSASGEHSRGQQWAYLLNTDFFWMGFMKESKSKDRTEVSEWPFPPIVLMEEHRCKPGARHWPWAGSNSFPPLGQLCERFKFEGGGLTWSRLSRAMADWSAASQPVIR